MTRTYSSPANWRPFVVVSKLIVTFLLATVFFAFGFGQTTVTFNTAGTFSWTCPVGVTSVNVQVWGGGGAGGGATSNGKGGGGGGGGGYTVNTSVAVIPGTVYNSITVGAGGTGSSGNGGNGGNTSVLFGSTTISANGGVGGGANDGAGGSGGSGTYSGGAGSAGLGGANRGGGGGGSAGSSSSGTSVTATSVGATAVVGGGPGGNGANNGNNDTPGNPPVAGPGGGGGGGYSKNANVVGGNGFAGQVILTYTCPVYSLTNTSASAACINGSSTITLTGTAASLPAGTYTVIYDLSAPNLASGLSTTMTVTTAGTAVFSTSTISNTGNTTITIKSLNRSVECISNLISNNTATITVNPLPQGSLTANGPICASGSGSLTWTATAGTGPYTVVYNDGVANRTVNNVTSGVPFSPFTDPVTSTTTYTLVSVTGVYCSRTSGFTGGSASITVNPLPQGSLTANGPFCSTGAGTLTWTATAGTGPYTIVYNDGIANRTVNNVSSGTAFAVFTTPVTSTTIYTLVSVTGVNCQRSSGFTNGAATITVSTLATPSNAGSNQTGSSTCGLTSVTLAANTPAVGTGAWSIISGTGGSVTTPASPSSTFSGIGGSSYTLRWTITPAAPCPASSNDVIITFNQTPNIVSSQTASVCNGAAFTITPVNGGGNTIPAGTSYSWGLPSVSGSLSGGATGTAASNISGSLSQTGTATETATYTVTPTTSICTGSTFPVTVAVQPTPTLTSSLSPTSICSSSATNFSYTATSASIVSYSWTRAAIASINGNVGGSGNTATISETLTSNSTSVVNVVYAITMTINGCSNTQNVTVAVKPKPVLTSPLSFSKCNNVPLAYTATSATSSVSYSWTRAAVTGISNAAVTTPVVSASINETLNNNTSSPVTNVVYAVTLDAAGCTNTENVTVTINPTPTVSASPTSQFVCSGSTVGITLSGTVTGTTFTWTRDNPAGLTYTGALNSLPGSGNVSGTISNSTNAPVTVSINATPTANGCVASTVNNIATIQVLPVASVNAVGSQTICHNSPTTAIPFSGTGTSYTWTNTNSAIGLAGSGNGNISSFTGTNAGTSPITGNLSVTAVYTVGGTSCNGGSQPFAITINPIPVLTSATSGLTTCSGSTFNYTPTSSATGVTTTFSWTRAVVAGISNLAASGTGNPAEVLVNTTSAAVNVTYVYTVSASNNAVSCTNATNYNVVVSVKPTPSIAMSPGASQSICQGVANNFAAITLSNPNALPGTSFSWTRTNGDIASGNIQGIAAGNSGNIPGATLTNTTGNIQTATFTGTATLNGCSSSTTVSVQVNPPIINNALTAPIEADICSLSKQVTFNTPNAQGGNGTYSYIWEYSETGNNSWDTIAGQTGPTLTFIYPQVQAFFRRTAISDGCSYNVSSNYQVNKPSTNGITQTTSNTTYCSGGTGATISLDASISLATYTLQYEVSTNNWQAASGFSPIVGNGSSIVFSNITVAGKYRILAVISGGGGCSQPYSEVTVTINPLPNAPTPVTANPAAICFGSNSNLNATTGSGITVNWYTTSTLGSPLNGTPLVSAANYSVSPGTNTTYYAEALNSVTGCVSNLRTSVAITVRQLPVMSSASTASVCSGGTFSIALAATNSPSSFSWQGTTTNPNVTGMVTTLQNPNGTLNNNGTALTLNSGITSAQTVSYTVIPYTTAPVCAGTPQTVVVTVDPKPVIASFTNAAVCSGNSFTAAIPAGNTVPTTPVTRYTWTDPTVSGLTGGSAQGTPQTSISQTLVNGTAALINAVYTVTPTAGACTGSNFTLTVPVNPKPFVANQAVAVCSGTPFTLPPFSGGSNIIPSGTTYGWDPPTGSNFTGYNLSTVSGQTNFTGTLTNTSPFSQVPVTATYTVTPTNPASPSNCVGNSFQVVATINPIPSTITPTVSASTICQGGSSPSVTFSGFNGIQPYTFTYIVTVNGVAGAAQTVSTSAGNTVSLPVSTSTSGTVMYTITKISDAGSTGCSRTVSNSVSVTVNPAPSGSISGSTTICASGSATLSITVPGTGFYSGTLSPGNIPFSGNGPTIAVIVSPASTTPYTIASLSNGSCSAASLPGNATVTIPSGTPGVWTCSVSNDWFDCRNWANGMVPDNLTNVTISTPNNCNPVINPASTFAPADKIARAANILISGTANLSFNGAGNLYVAGNWTNTVGPAGFTAGTSTVSFMGSSGAGCTQTVNTTAGNSENFYNLVINNTCNRDAAGQGDNVTLSSPVNVGGTLMLTDGIVKTSSTNLLTITNPAVAAVSNGSVASYINGPIARLTNSTGTYIFPTGNPAAPAASGVYRPATVTPVSSSPTSFTAQYFPTYAPEYNTSKLGVTGILETEYWDIRPTGACSVEAVIGLPYVNPGSAASWTGNMGPCATCNVAIAKPVFTSSNSWYFTDYPTYSGTGFNGSIPEDRAYNNNGWIYSKPITCAGFSSPHFTFGFNYNNILPTQLISFEGKLVDADAKLVWILTDTKELAGFELEHSGDGNNFKKIAAIPPGNDNHYQYIDARLATGPHYYRLALRDKQGKIQYSRTVLLVVGNNLTLIKGLRANPVNETAHVDIWSGSAQYAKALIFDMTGRLIDQQTWTLLAGKNDFTLRTSGLAQGVYNLFIKTEDGALKNIRMVKE